MVRDLAFLIGALGLALLVIPVANWAEDRHTMPEPAEATEPAVVTTTTLAEPVVVEETVDPPRSPRVIPAVSELPQAVTAVLAASGNAGFMSAEELAALLPESIVRTLIERGAVLTLVESALPAPSGVQ